VHGGSLLVALLRLADKVHVDVAELLLNAGLVHLHLAGLEKTRFFFNQWFFLGFLGFLGFWGFFGFFGGFFGFFYYIFAQKREFLWFFQFQEYFWVHPDVKLYY
jgi:hypothetical protein